MQYEFCRICMHARLVRCISRRDWSQDTQTLTCVSNAPGPNLVLNKVVNFEGSILVPEMNCASSKSGKSSSRSSHAGYCVEIKELALIVVIFKVEKSTATCWAGNPRTSILLGLGFMTELLELIFRVLFSLRRQMRQMWLVVSWGRNETAEPPVLSDTTTFRD